MESLKERFLKIPDGQVVLVITKAEEYTKKNIEMLSLLLNELNYPGIYITISRPYSNLKDFLKSKGVKTEKLFFIDAVSRNLGSDVKRTEDCIFLEHPADLTSIGVALDQILSLLGDSKPFIFLDSLSTLLIYNSAGSLTKFSHFLSGRIRMLKLKGIIISLEKEVSPELLSTIIVLCDEVIRMD